MVKRGAATGRWRRHWTRELRTACAVWTIFLKGGGKIPNLGSKTVQGLTTRGEKMSVKFQVTQVNRPPIAVSKLTEAGHDVNLHARGGTIRNQASGKVTSVRKADGVYVLDIWVRGTPASLSGGRRQ